MKIKIYDGGPAFPVPPEIIVSNANGDSQWVFPKDGMSLRDWFAGQALAGNLAADTQSRHDASKQAAWAYAQADEMLAARK